MSQRVNKINVHSYHRDQYLEALRLRETKRLTGSEIARRLELKVKTVNHWLRRRQKDGAVHVQAPYSGKYRKALKLWREEQMPAYSIAKELGLPDSLVRYWLRQEKKHVEDNEFKTNSDREQNPRA